MMEKRGRCDIDQVNVVAGQEFVHILDVGNSEPLRGRVGGLTMRAGHARQLDTGHLGKLLQGIEAETTAANDPETDFALIH